MNDLQRSQTIGLSQKRRIIAAFAQKRILHLTLLRHWFDEIAAGRKKREYRVIKPYWTKRLAREYDEIWFRNGYSKGMPFMRVEWAGCTTETIDGKMYFAVLLGKILEIRNYARTNQKTARIPALHRKQRGA